MKRTGELLKKAREDKRLSLHEVALFLKINSRVLQAIEDGDQSHLPARTFLRGFIQSYAKFLKLDPQNVLQVFTEENSPAPTLPIAPLQGTNITMDVEKPAENPSSIETKQPVPDKSEIDVVNLEKSILTQSQVAQDKLGFKTIAVSVVGLLLVVVLYFANNVVKKYQKEAQVDPVASLENDARANSPEPSTETSDAAIVSSKDPVAASTPEVTSKLDSPNSSVTSPNSSSNATASSPVAQKPVEKPVNKPPEKQIEKPVATSTASPVTSTSSVAPKAPSATQNPPATAPVLAAPVNAAVSSADKKEPRANVTEGKVVEVIVEANDAVEIEYSSLKTSPQKMFLKADQVHTFKSRSGVRLKISNGGAVNIIMNGRDLGVPGAAGQPVQVTY